MIDNFKIVSSLLSFSINDFYLVQIIKRRKDNSDMKKSVSIKDRLFLYSLQDCLDLKNKIIDLCDQHNARAYITINPRNLEKIGLETLRQIAEYISKKEYKAIKDAYFSACGQYASKKNYWFVDLDEEHLNRKQEIDSELGTNKVCEIPTKTGIHIVTKPFDPRIFYQKFAGIQLEKDGSTNLYIP